MGLFSSKKIERMGTAISPLTANRPNLVLQAILRAKFNEWPVTPTITQTLLDGFNIRPDKSYDFAAGDNGGLPPSELDIPPDEQYVLGLPQSAQLEFNPRWDSAYQAIASDAGVDKGQISVKEQRYTSSVLLEDIKDLIYNELAMKYFNYMTPQGHVDFKTGEIHGHERANAGEVCTVTKVDFFRPGGQVLDPELVEGVSLSYELKFYNPSTPNSTRTILWNIPFNIRLARMTDINSYIYFIEYSINYSDGSTSPTYRWTFDYLYDDYPGIDFYPYAGTEAVPLHPIYPLRMEYEWLDTLAATGSNAQQRQYDDIYTGVKIGLNHLGLDYDKLKEALHDNDDIDKVFYAMVILGVPLGKHHREKSQEMLEYMHKLLIFFKEHYNSNSKAEFEQKYADAQANPSNSLATSSYLNKIQMAEQNKINQTLYWNYIEVNTSSGTYSEALAGQYVEGYVVYEDTRDPNDDLYYNESLVRVTYHDKKTKMATTVTLGGPVMVTYTTSTKNNNLSAYHTLWTVANYDQEDNNDTDGLYLPFCEPVLESMGSYRGRAAAMEGLLLLTYSIDTQTVKWYERGAFQILIQIIIVIVSIYSGQYQNIAAAGTFTEVAAAVIQAVLINIASAYAINIVVSELVDILGLENSFIAIAVVAVVAAIYGYYNAESFATFADQLLKTTAAVMEPLQEAIKDEFNALQAEYKEFMSEYERLMEEIFERAQALVGGVDPMWLTNVSGIIAGETPEQYYYRTTNLNPNELGYQALNGYYDDRLKLPSLSDTENMMRQRYFL